MGFIRSNGRYIGIIYEVPTKVIELPLLVRGRRNVLKTKMAVREKGAVVDVLDKRISDLERRILTSEEDVLGLKGSSVIPLIDFLSINPLAERQYMSPQVLCSLTVLGSDKHLKIVKCTDFKIISLISHMFLF